MAFIHFRNSANLTYPLGVSVRTNYSKYAGSLLILFLAATTTFLASCGASGSKTAASTTSVAVITLLSSTTSVKSDGSDLATITATALTSGNSVLAGQNLSFTASTGQISTASGVTDANGQATFTFSAGPSGINRTATITATVTGTTVSGSIPMQITGSTLTLTPSTSVAAGTALPLTVTAKNSAGAVVPGQAIQFSISSGSGTLSAASATTDATGVANVSVTGTGGGTLTVLARWVDVTGNVTASTSQSYTITATGGAFGIATPATSPFPVSIGTPLSVVVNTPTTVNGVTVTHIRYATSIGGWGAAAPGTPTLTVVPAGATDTQTFQPGTGAGNASIQVDALDGTGKVLSSSTAILAISAVTGTQISLQAAATTLKPSSGTNSSTTTLTAMVRDAANNPVGGASVLFQLGNTTGTGESVSPVVATTDSTNTATTMMGRALSTFTAGTSTTPNAYILASVVGANCAIVGNPLCAKQQITVGGSAASIAIGVGTSMSSISGDTAYQQPVTVQVTDSNGAALSGAVVSLSLWPVEYYKGVRDAKCLIAAGALGPFPNEDKNFNLILDPGEDVDGPGGYPIGLGPVDNALWPTLSSAGSIPASVTTGADGTATFNWVYLKQYAQWMRVRIRASTMVQGTQSQADLTVSTSALAVDVATPCPLSNSPFN